MDVPQAAAQSGIVPESDRRAFVERLTRTPPPDPHVLPPHPEQQRLQGDILKGFPFVLVKDDGSPVMKDQTCLMLNNTCDLQQDRSNVCNVALAADYGAYSEHVRATRNAESASGFLTAVQRNKVDDLLFLADCPEYPNGLLIYLNRIATIPFTLYEKSLGDGARLASLSQDGFWFFLIKLTRFLARAESGEVVRHGARPSQIR